MLLFLTPSPPNELGRVRSLNILKALKSLNIDVTLVTLYNKKQEKYLNEAKPYVKEISQDSYQQLTQLEVNKNKILKKASHYGK